MALSQLLDDSPMRFGPKDSGAGDAYDERHRLALEALLSGGVDRFQDFLGKEGIPSFLSDDEVLRLRGAAVAPPRCASLLLHHAAEDPAAAAEQRSLCGSADCSSVTYFPEASDLEPPLLELGWPAFTAGSYRGITRAVAHFQPGYGECIYGCKEAARRMIRNAKEVIAIVTDALTDLDIFGDLQEASCQRKVPVYVLLDQSCSPAFLKMCRNVGVRLDDLQQMRVRVISGTTYYTRSGARVTGKVHERFMLIDGNRVATGSYRFNWTDGKLNSSNLIELSGQITEKFDEEFRVLYAQSSPVTTRAPPGDRSHGVAELHKHPVPSSPYLARETPACLTSTPSREPRAPAARPAWEPATPDRREADPASDPSSSAEDGTEEILAGCAARPYLAVTPGADPCHASTQTSRPATDSGTQTDPPQPTDLATPGGRRPNGGATSPRSASPRPPCPAQPVADSTLKECFLKLTKERLHHYSAIRSKLESMVTALSQRRELVDVTNVLGAPGAHRDCGQEPGARLLLAEGAGKQAWPRARCVD